MNMHIAQMYTAAHIQRRYPNRLHAGMHRIKSSLCMAENIVRGVRCSKISLKARFSAWLYYAAVHSIPVALKRLELDLLYSCRHDKILITHGFTFRWTELILIVIIIIAYSCIAF